MTEEHERLSDVGVEFFLVCNLTQKLARIEAMSQTRAAAERGVKYQIIYEQVGETPKISPPMTIGEVRDTKINVDILGGGTLALRIIDHDDRHLADAVIDGTKWPSVVSPAAHTFRQQMSLYVPEEILG